APKELMLFVKNMMFLDGAIATLAPELDILEEIQKVHTEIGTRHGERLALEMGVDPSLATVFDATSVKAAMALPAAGAKLAHRAVQGRRDLTRRGLEARRKEQESR